MGHKVNPISVRLPITRAWKSRWFLRGREFGRALVEDIKLRSKIHQILGTNAGIASIEIERRNLDSKVLIQTSKPGILIGWQGKGITELRKKLELEFGKKLSLNVIEVKQAELHATIVASNIGNQISRRIAYRRAIRQAIERTMNAGAKGIKIVVSGRLRGAEIARREKFVEGLVPTATLRSDIDFAVYHANTTHGIIGIKVWIYKGERTEE